MKIRNGFVSNSSSSSYVLFADKEFFDKTFEKFKDIDPILTGYRQEKCLNEIKFLGRDIVVLSDWITAGGGGPEIELNEEDEDKIEKMWDRFFQFKETLEENKEKCHVVETDI